MTDIDIEASEGLLGRVARAAGSAGQTEQEFMLTAIVEKVERSKDQLGGDVAGVGRLLV